MNNQKQEQKSVDDNNIEDEIIDINKIEKSLTDKMMQLNKNNKGNMNNMNNSRTSSFSSYRSNSSADIDNRYESYETIPFKVEELDLDLPNFTPTKYNSPEWKIIHCIFYSAFSLGYLACLVLFIMKKNYVELIKAISDGAFCVYNFMNWFHYRRGCIGKSNLNSKVKTNRDKSIKAKLLRSESGWKYFFALIANLILLYGDAYFFLFCEEQNPDYWNILFVGFMIISLSQILKIDKILTDNAQYKVINDLPNCFVEILLFFGSLNLTTTYLIRMVYYFNQEAFRIFIIVINGIGILLILLSDFSLIFRYFFSGYDDLNTSTYSNITL